MAYYGLTNYLLKLGIKMTPDQLEALQEKCPFLTYLVFQDEEYVGVVQNSDAQLISIYVLDDIMSVKEKSHFLSLAQLWWDDSNQHIPINIFLREEFDQFKRYLKNFSRKNVSDIQGHMVCIEDNFQKRTKKKKVQLVREMD